MNDMIMLKTIADKYEIPTISPTWVSTVFNEICNRYSIHQRMKDQQKAHDIRISELNEEKFRLAACEKLLLEILAKEESATVVRKVRERMLSAGMKVDQRNGKAFISVEKVRDIETYDA